MTRLYTPCTILLLCCLLLLVLSSAKAQIIYDNFDAYDVGSTTGTNAAHWSTWSGNVGGVEDGVVIDGPAFSAPNSMVITEGQVQDVLLLLGNKTSGKYLLQWMCYVLAGKSAYYNIQESESPGVAWNLDVFFNAQPDMNPGTPGIGTIPQTGTQFSYPENEWFRVTNLIDLDNNTLTLQLNGQQIMQMPYPGNIGAVDFFSINNQNRYFIDDVLFTNTPAAVTFRVDLGDMTPDPAGVFFAASINGWSDEPMTNSTGTVWEITKNLNALSSLDYKFKNGPNGWETAIVPNSNLAPCGVDDGFGNYNRTLTVLGDATLDAACIGFCVTCDLVSSTADDHFDYALRISPNPATDRLSIDYAFDQMTKLEIMVTNSLGQQLLSQRIDDAHFGSEILDISHLKPGVYLILLRSGYRRTAKKLVVH